MSEGKSTAATYCIACRRPIKIVSFYRADGFGPYCSDCADIKGIDPQMAITLPPATDSPITTVKLGEPIYRYPKPRWRTCPVPMSLSPGDEVFYKAFIDGIGVWYGVGVGVGDGVIEDPGSRGEDGILIEHGDYMWLPLSDILALVEAE